MFKHWKLWQRFALYFGALALLLISLAIPSLLRLSFGETVVVEGEIWLPSSSNPQQLNIQLNLFELTLDQVDEAIKTRLETEQDNVEFFFSGVSFEQTLYLHLITDDHQRLVDVYLSTTLPTDRLYLSFDEVFVEAVYARLDDFIENRDRELEGVRLVPNLRTNYYPTRQEMLSLEGEDDWVTVDVTLVVWRGQAQIRSIHRP